MSCVSNIRSVIYSFTHSFTHSFVIVSPQKSVTYIIIFSNFTCIRSLIRSFIHMFKRRKCVLLVCLFVCLLLLFLGCQVQVAFLKLVNSFLVNSFRYNQY